MFQKFKVTLCEERYFELEIKALGDHVLFDFQNPDNSTSILETDLLKLKNPDLYSQPKKRKLKIIELVEENLENNPDTYF